MITVIYLKGKDTKHAIKELVSNAEYDNLKVEIYRVGPKGKRIIEYKHSAK